MSQCGKCGMENAMPTDVNCWNCGDALGSLAAPTGSAETCDKCDYWVLAGAETPPLRYLGHCDLFDKVTEATHGTKCTGWTPKEQPNEKLSRD